MGRGLKQKDIEAILAELTEKLPEMVPVCRDASLLILCFALP
jgi:hypothetical protein